MHKMMNKIHTLTSILLLCLALLFACDNVEDGYRADYNETSAEFSVDLTTAERGTDGDTAIFSVSIRSENEIQSILVSSDVSGSDGTGYIIDTSQTTDPLIDHAYGTVQPGTYNLDISYYYVFPSDTVETTLTFTLIDDEGEKEIDYELEGIPDISAYDNTMLYTKSESLTDAFATSNGEVFSNISEYTEYNSWNLEIQSNFDIIFLVGDNQEAMLLCPYHSNVSVDLTNKNKTVFKRLSGLTEEAFDTLTHITLSEITEDYGVKNGSSIIDSVVVGDLIGFRTDFESANPYKYGILKVNAIHATNVDHYDGTSYVIDMDILTQN